MSLTVMSLPLVEGHFRGDDCHFGCNFVFSEYTLGLFPIYIYILLLECLEKMTVIGYKTSLYHWEMDDVIPVF